MATFACALDHETVPPAVRAGLAPMLADLIGVVVAGMRTPEMRALLESGTRRSVTPPSSGTARHSTHEESAYLAAVAACVLELDEGNKHAGGHPAAHVVFAALAAAAVPIAR